MKCFTKFLNPVGALQRTCTCLPYMSDEKPLGHSAKCCDIFIMEITSGWVNLWQGWQPRILMLDAWLSVIVDFPAFEESEENCMQSVKFRNMYCYMLDSLYFWNQHLLLLRTFNYRLQIIKWSHRIIFETTILSDRFNPLWDFISI